MAEWTLIPLGAKLFLATDESSVSKHCTAVENALANENGGLARFPMSRPFVALDGTKTYLFDWRDNLVAVTDTGRIYTIDQNGAVSDRTGVPVSGGRRAVFAKTDQELAIAAGAEIISLGDGGKSRVLSKAAPRSTHVAYKDSFLFAIEPYSGRFDYSAAGAFDQWPGLNVFTAESLPDDLNAIVTTPFGEVLLCGTDSIEQWESNSSGGASPFFRRYTTGEGLYAPYTLLPTKIGTFAVNTDLEIVRFLNQSTQTMSEDIQAALERIDDVGEAWAAEMKIASQKLIVFQFPNATNIYGTRGVTFAHDYRQNRWCSLYGWDAALGLPTRWPAWSYRQKWNRRFIGVPGGVEEFVEDPAASPATQRMLMRTGHIGDWGASRIDGVRLRFKRGHYQGASPGRVALRVNRDNEGFLPPVYRDFGAGGDRVMSLDFGGFGYARTWQFEFAVTDNAVVEFKGSEAYVERVRF